MKKIILDIAFVLLIPFIGIAYFLDNVYKNMKRNRHRRQLRKSGSATLHNPYADKWN